MADDIRTCRDLDDRLAAYVDGEDSVAARHAIDTHLSACAPCRDVARGEAAARKLVHDRRDALMARAPAALRTRCEESAAGCQVPASGVRLQGTVLPSSVRPVSSVLRRWAPLSLAATLVLAVAGVFVFGLNDRVEALAASLTMDHAKCFKMYGTASDAEPAASERAWEQDQGWPITVPETAPAEELRLVNVRRCFTTDGRAAHLMYTWRGEPLSVYVLQGETGRDQTVRKMGAQAIIWSANRRTYAVVSSDASRDLAPIVAYISARVR